MIKISVITINYNNGGGLRRTVRSVIEQTFGNFEYIVIDGGSTDESAQVIEEYKSKINFWISERDNGIYHAMNKGIKAAKGEYLLFLNSGDYLVNNNVLKDVTPALQGEGIIYGDIITTDQSVQNYKSLPETLSARHFMESTLWHPATFIQKNLFDTYGVYNENYRISSDYEFFLKTIVKHKISTKHIALPVAIFDLNGISNDPGQFELMLSERKKIQKDFFNDNELQELERFEIEQTGQNSKLYKFVPKTKSIQKIYHKLYYHWYKWRVGQT